MIMMGDKKKMLGAILGPEKGEEEQGEAPNELHALSHEAIEAVHSKDVAGFADAIKAMVDCCGSAPDEESNEG